MKNLRKFNRIRNLFLRKRNDINFMALSCISPMFCDFVNEGGTQLFIKRGLEIYLQTARGYWKILKGKHA